MLTTALFALAALAAQQADTDTTFGVTQGTRLRVQSAGGDIVVRAWDRNQVRVQASHSRRTRIYVERSGAVLEIESRAERGPSNMVDYQITVPAWMALDLGGMYATVDVEGTRAPITAETLEGEITVKGGAESVKLVSINGRIRAEGIRGRVQVNSVSDDIVLRDIVGDIVAEGVSGEIILVGIDSRNVDLQTVSGDLVYEGRIHDGGRYSFLTHSGEVFVSVAEGVNATISTAVGSGEVRATFPLPQSERPGRRRQTYRLGTGSAVVEVEAFSGDVRLLRPAELRERVDRELARSSQRRPQEQHEDHDTGRLDRDPAAAPRS